MKRVYRSVAVVPADGGFEVRLDSRALRTPARNPLALPTAALAGAIAAEWDAQGDTVVPATMPLTQIASTAVDVIGHSRDAVVGGVAGYAETDLLCYRAEHPAELAERQAQAWQPLLDWATLRFDARLAVCTGLMPRPQPPDAVRALRRAVEAHDDWSLSALQVVTGACGSLVVALALIDGRLDAEAAFTVSQVDETFQIEHWGEDAEATARRAGLQADIAAARRFVDVLRTA